MEDKAEWQDWIILRKEPTLFPSVVPYLITRPLASSSVSSQAWQNEFVEVGTVDTPQFLFTPTGVCDATYTWT
jgi:hypothetical protein